MPLATAGAWSVEVSPAIQLVADRIALDACFAPGGLLARAEGASPPDIDFGKYWCVLATDGRRTVDRAAAHLEVGDQGRATLAIPGRDPGVGRARSAHAWLVPRSRVRSLAVGAQALELPLPASQALVLPVLDVRGPARAPASLHASWRITDAADLQAVRAAFGTAAPDWPADWVDPATECVVIARLSAGSGSLQRMHVLEEEGVDVLTLVTGQPAAAAEAPVAHWLKLPRRARTLTLVHRAEGAAGPVETILGTWPPLR